MPDRARTGYPGPQQCPACGAPLMDPQPRPRPGWPQEMRLWYRCGAEQTAAGQINASSTWVWSHIGSVACDYVGTLRDIMFTLLDSIEGIEVKRGKVLRFAEAQSQARKALRHE